MPETIADFLKRMRTSRGFSLRGLAKRAGISHSAVRSWERGDFQPRLPELEATLEALGAGSAHRRRALALVEAPRAVVRLRQEAAQPEKFLAAGQAPQGGDLLRAMRMRQGLTLDEAAQGIGVRASTLSRWERGEMWPSSENLHALCYLLKAAEEEITALSGGRFWLPAIGGEGDTPEQWEKYVFAVYHAPSVRDLRFLALETQMWRLAARRPFALPLLQRTYAYHARALMETNRFAEVNTYVDRTLALARQGHGQQEEWTWAIIAAAAAEAQGGRRPRPMEAARILGDWIESVRSPTNRAWMLSERAIYLAQGGRAEEAVTLSGAACQLSATLEDCVELMFRQRDRAGILTRAGRHGEALSALEAAAPLMVLAEDPLIRHRLLEAECLLGVDRRSEAQESMHHALQLIEHYGFDYMKPRADALAHSL
jgi:transcriptional regulator with XRE-family HTH domain